MGAQQDIDHSAQDEVAELKLALVAAGREQARLQSELETIIDQLPRLRQLIEHSTDIMLLVDEEGVIADCNRAAAVELRYPRDGLYGTHISELWAGTSASLSTALEQAEPTQHSILTGDLVRLDETQLPIEAHIAAFDDGGSRYRVVVARNVSDRQQLELALRDIQEQLAFVNERQNLEQVLQKTNRLEALGTLAGSLAHDFNNIFSVIRGNVEIVLDLPEDEQQEALDDAREGLEQAATMAHQLLTFSRGGTVVRKSIDSKQWLASSSRLAMSGSTHALSLSLADDLPDIEIDEGQLTQVLHNLIKNAQQAMPTPGTISVAACLGEILPDCKEALCVYVEDEGEGIPEELAGRIFDPFFTTKEEGTGIGLATSQKIVREHGGTLRTLPNPGAGARFEIALPISTNSALQTSWDARCSPRAEDLRGMRVLLMDDEANVRGVIARILRAAGATVDECDRGEDAVALYRASLDGDTPYDATVLDLVIRTGIGGIKTIGLLREMDPSVRAIVCSGHSDEAVRERFRALGFCAYVAKPFSSAVLVGAIADAIKGRARSHHG
tara:strand:+ start:15980 stop:17650 length:1671 start_codon:yes stop_codon:yes gene_type:complete